MFRIDSNNIVTISRGDTGLFTIFINQGTEFAPERYILQKDDKLYLGVMEPNQLFEDAIIKKVFDSTNVDDDGDVIVELQSKDTEHLLSGLYYYQLKLEKVEEETSAVTIDTIRPNTRFYIID